MHSTKDTIKTIVADFIESYSPKCRIKQSAFEFNITQWFNTIGYEQLFLLKKKDMVEVFGAFFLLLGAGTLWRFIPHVPDADTVRRSLGGVVMNFFLPALTFTVLFRAPVNAELWQIPMTAFVCVIASLSLSYIFLSFMKKYLKGLTNPSMGALMLAATWGNVTYLGLPTVTALLGEEYRRIPIYFDLLAMTPLLWTVGVMIAEQYGKPMKEQMSPPHIGVTLSRGIKTMLTLPPFWSACAGLVCNVAGIPVPDFLLKACTLMGNAVPPMMIFSIGLALRVPHVHHIAWIIPPIVIKLLFAPYIGSLCAAAVGLQGNVLKATVLESAMPTMVLTMVIADRFSLDIDLLAQIIALSTIISFLTVGFLWG